MTSFFVCLLSGTYIFSCVVFAIFFAKSPDSILPIISVMALLFLPFNSVLLVYGRNEMGQKTKIFGALPFLVILLDFLLLALSEFSIPG